jgi:hypothetical protein
VISGGQNPHGLFVIRAWSGLHLPYSLGLRCSSPLTSPWGLEGSLTVTHTDAVVQALQGWLSEVLEPLLVSLDEGVAVDLRAAQALGHRLLDLLYRPASPISPRRRWQACRLTFCLVGMTTGCCWRPRTGVSCACTPWKRSPVSSPVGGACDLTAAAQAAIRAEPLRESAHAAPIRIHLAEGNQSEALREFDRYRRLLQAELGLQPTRSCASWSPAFSAASREGNASRLSLGACSAPVAAF